MMCLQCSCSHDCCSSFGRIQTVSNALPLSTKMMPAATMLLQARFHSCSFAAGAILDSRLCCHRQTNCCEHHRYRYLACAPRRLAAGCGRQNRTLQHFEIGVRHGNLKKKIFNDKLYEKERMIATQRLSNALTKIFQHNKVLHTLVVQYKHANFDVALQITANLIHAVKNGFSNIKVFNGFPLH